MVGMAVRRGSAVTAIGLLFAASLSAATPARAQQTDEPQNGGRVIFAMNFEPLGGLNPWLICCTSLSYAPQIARTLMPHAYVQDPDFAYVPDVLEAEAEVTTDPFTITYRIKPEAVWNDGVPVSARDFVFTWRTFTNPHNQVYDRAGYDLITSADVVDAKMVTFSFKKPYADYKQLFADVFPRHALIDKNFNKVWNRTIPISAGPFEFGEWERGDHLTLVRNENYWGEHLAYLDEVEFRFINKIPKQIEALSTGAVDAIYPTADPRLPDVYGFPDVEVQTSPSVIWEHLDFGFKNQLLQKPFIRRAIAFAIDREAIVEEIIRPIDPDATLLDNLLFMTNEPEYEPHFDVYRYDPEETHRILNDHGCSMRNDGIYRCAGGRLGFEYTTTNNNPLRKHLAEVIADQLGAVGIDVEIRRRDPSIVFGIQVLVRGDFDFFNFAWVATTPRYERGIWACDGSQNFNRYCNEDVGPLLKEAESEIDPERRARLVNMADDVMALDLPVLPLYQKPTFLAYSSAVHGMIDNPTAETPTWNIGDWWLDPTP